MSLNINQIQPTAIQDLDLKSETWTNGDMSGIYVRMNDNKVISITLNIWADNLVMISSRIRYAESGSDKAISGNTFNQDDISGIKEFINKTILFYDDILNQGASSMIHYNTFKSFGLKKSA